MLLYLSLCFQHIDFQLHHLQDECCPCKGPSCYLRRIWHVNCACLHLCVHCWWADVYADEKSFGNVASSALDEMRLAWLSQPSAHGSWGPHDATDKSVSALNAMAVRMRECKMNGYPPRSWFSPWTSHHSSWLILCAALLRKSQVVLIQWHGICQESTAHTSPAISLTGLCMLLHPLKWNPRRLWRWAIVSPR